MRDRRVVVVGLGEVGRSVLRLLSRRGELTVCGVDTDHAVCRAAMEETGLWCVDRYADLGLDGPFRADVVSLCLPCDAEFEPFRTVITEIAEVEWTRPLYSVECTLPNPRWWPWGDEFDDDPIWRKEADLIAFPHRLAPHEPGHAEADSDVRVMGGRTNEALHRGMRFWGPIVGFEKIRPCTWAEAVLTKVLENGVRYVEIALAQECALAADRYGVEPHRLLELMSTKWNVEMRHPLGGVGGHCLPKDVEFAQSLTLGEESLFWAAVAADGRYRQVLGDYEGPRKDLGSTAVGGSIPCGEDGKPLEWASALDGKPAEAYLRKARVPKLNGADPPRRTVAERDDDC